MDFDSIVCMIMMVAIIIGGIPLVGAVLFIQICSFYHDEEQDAK